MHHFVFVFFRYYLKILVYFGDNIDLFDFTG
jgi:hypothetical protein